MSWIAMAASAAWGFVKREPWMILLLVVAFALGWLYTDFRRLTADRDGAVAEAKLICASVGTPFDASAKHPRGSLCQAAVAGLAKFKADTLASSNQVLAAAQQAHEAKAATDLSAAATDRTRASAAAAHMKDTNDAVSDDHVDGSWFADFNRLAGLHTPAGGAGR